MRGLRFCCRYSPLLGVSPFQLGVVRSPCRWILQQERVEAETALGNPKGGLNINDTNSTSSSTGSGDLVQGVSQSFEEDAFAGEFDELEAASQEIHDLCYAMINHLRKTDPDETKDLFERRCARRFREPVHEHKRRLLHEHNKGLQRRNCYRTEEELKEATQLFLQFGEKLLLLLTKPVMDRMIESAGKGCRDCRSDGVHKYRKPLERASWRVFPHRWFKHAPFEVQQLRSDMPEFAVLNTRTARDLSTIRSLFTLMEPQHPFRSQLESRLFEITQEYDPVHKINKSERNSSPSGIDAK
ncbi:uncharacterized protein TM35_000091040 [Trypanosoma theileri]|uniref:Uncharacterized protein n=1 Tax=Trypanosoma theileri TaxID=67003 RepID=A0A1X0NZE1_9TRYP|nr:uncharacterized protein TM35_000091040 [Trypanosoma theileri]ORC90054.1 hypothetical protein TM35_000091040 [Trypanosoma theileri]